MSLEPNKNLGQQFIDLCNRQDYTAVFKLFAPEFRSYLPGAPGLDRDGWKSTMQVFFAAFPDFRHDIEELIATDDRIILRLVLRGTHQGNFNGIPPTGKQIEVRGIAINHIASGLIVENHVEIDRIALLQQLGVIPVSA